MPPQRGDDVNRWSQRGTRRGRPWRLMGLRRRSFTRWLLVFAVLMMLGQQAAMAAYACTMTPGAMGPMMAMSPTDSMKAMGNTCPEMRGLSDHLLCQKHCAPDTTAQPDSRTTSVPSNVLTALPPMPSSVALVAPSSVRADARRYRQQAPPRPPSKLFCSLQI